MHIAKFLYLKKKNLPGVSLYVCATFNLLISMLNHLGCSHILAVVNSAAGEHRSAYMYLRPDFNHFG